MSVKVVRLVGDDSDIVRVVKAAVSTIPNPRRDDWARAVGDLGGLRQRYMRDAAAEPPPNPTPVAQAPRRSVSEVLWWVLLSCAVAVTASGAALQLPPKRRVVADHAELMPTAAVLLIIGAVLFAVVAMVPVPSGARRTVTARALAIIGIVLLPVAFVILLIRASVAPDTLAAADWSLWWWLSAAVALIAGIIVVIRTKPVPVPRPVVSSQPRTLDAGSMQQRARQLAGARPYRRADQPAWKSVLNTITVADDVRAQALQLGPYAYITWAYYDGEYPLSSPHTLG